MVNLIQTLLLSLSIFGVIYLSYYAYIFSDIDNERQLSKTTCQINNLNVDARSFYELEGCVRYEGDTCSDVLCEYIRPSGGPLKYNCCVNSVRCVAVLIANYRYDQIIRPITRSRYSDDVWSRKTYSLIPYEDGGFIDCWIMADQSNLYVIMKNPYPDLPNSASWIIFIVTILIILFVSLRHTFYCRHIRYLKDTNRELNTQLRRRYAQVSCTFVDLDKLKDPHTEDECVCCCESMSTVTSLMCAQCSKSVCYECFVRLVRSECPHCREPIKPYILSSTSTYARRKKEEEEKKERCIEINS